MLSIVVAIMAEAKPIIEHFDLKPDHSYEQQVYRKDDGKIELIVSGARIARAAAGVGAIGKKGNKWLNIGICGHRDLPIGSIHMASKIHFDEFIDYPIFLFKPPCPLQAVKTVMHGEEEYPEDVLYEMEAHTFFKAALTFSPAELIHVVKIVSDNKENSLRRLNKGHVSELVKNQIPIIEKVIEELLALPEMQPERDLSFYYNRWHFTETQKQQLKKFMRERDNTFMRPRILHCKTASEVLKTFEEQVRLNND